MLQLWEVKQRNLYVFGLRSFYLHEGEAERISAVSQQRLTFRERLVIEHNSIDLGEKKKKKKSHK